MMIAYTFVFENGQFCAMYGIRPDRETAPLTCYFESSLILHEKNILCGEFVVNRFVRRCFDMFIKMCALPANIVLLILPANKQSLFEAEIFKRLYNRDEYGLISFYPKSTETLQVRTTERSFGDVAIILQGPVILRDHFTVNTVKMYKQYYDSVNVIVSTWSDTPEDEAKALRDAGATVLLNEYPTENYTQNLNLQLISSLAGVRAAKEMGRGIKYLCKTRTDQRYYNPCALSFLLGRHQPGMITFLGGVSNSFYRWPFYISDFFAFGEIKELEELYSCDLDTAEDEEKWMAVRRSRNGLVKEIYQAELDRGFYVPPKIENELHLFMCAERKIAYSYFTRKEDIGKYDTIQDAYLVFLRHHVIVADAEALGFYWFKYRNQSSEHLFFHRTGKLDMAKWYEIHS